MHSVQRSPEPSSLASFRAVHSQWETLHGGERRDIRDTLTKDFGEVCAYCQQACQAPAFGVEAHNAETIDHFRPRSRFPDLWLDWLNLIYACRRCNRSKGNKWLDFDQDTFSRGLQRGGHSLPSEYVNPNAIEGRRPANEFFDFDLDTGEIVPATGLDYTAGWVASRTIRDIDLNDSQLGENDPAHLLNLRLARKILLDTLIQQIRTGAYEESEARGIVTGFARLGQPFSSFVGAYLASEHPDLT